MDEALYDSLSAAYQPLKSCVEQKLGTPGTSREALYSEIAASGGLPQILREERQLLGIPRAETLTLPNSKRVHLVIEALERKDPYADKAYTYRVFQLRRQIAASSIFARSPSISCELPQELGYWVQEADDFETFINLWTYYDPFRECEGKHEASIANYESLALDAIVRTGNLSELRRATSEYLAPSNPFVILANLDNITDANRVRALMGGLGEYLYLHSGSDSVDERFGAKVRTTMVNIFLKEIVASAMKSSCVPSEHLTFWMQEAKRRRQE